MSEHKRQGWGPFMFAVLACAAFFLLLLLAANGHMEQYWQLRDLQRRVGQLEQGK